MSIMKREFLIAYILLFLFQNNSSVECLIVGSDTAPSRESLATFPAADTNNTMLGFAAFNNGFTLEDSTTTCTYNNFIPIVGPVTMNKGGFILFQDAFFNNEATFMDVGEIYAKNHAITLPKSLAEFKVPASSTTDAMLIDNGVVVLRASTTFQSPFRFRGDSTILGRGNRLTLSKSAPLEVLPGSKLILQDLEICGVGDDNIRCFDDTASVVLRRCKLNLSRNFTFSVGAISIESEAVITGTSTFNFSTTKTSTISSKACLFLDNGVNFRYAPNGPYNNLITFEDNTSVWYFNNCDLSVSSTGLQLSTGSICIENKVTWSSEGLNSAEGIRLDNSATMKILGGSLLNVYGFISTE